MHLRYLSRSWWFGYLSNHMGSRHKDHRLENESQINIKHMIPRLEAHILLLGYALALNPWGLLTHYWINNHKHCIEEIGSQIDWISIESYKALKYDETLVQVERGDVWRRWWWWWWRRWWWQHFVVEEIWLWRRLQVSWFFSIVLSLKGYGAFTFYIGFDVAV